MFRKVQLKFFGIITAILLAIFIAVLSSINIIMDTVIEHQTKSVLSEVAENVEYNSSMNPPFTFNRTEDSRFFDNRRDDPPPEKPDAQPEPKTTASTSAETAETTVTAQTTVTSAEATEETTPETQEAPAEEPQEVPAPAEAPAETPPPEDTTAAQVFAPTEHQDDDDDDDGDDDDDDGDDDDDDKDKRGEQPQTPTGYGGWGWFDPNQPNPWNNWGNNDKDKDKDKNKDDKKDDGQQPNWGQQNPWWIPVTPTANNGGAPVLEGYSIICNAEEETTSAAATTATAKTSSATSASAPPESKNREPAPNNMMNREPVPKSLGSINFFIIMADSDGKFAASLNTDLTEEAAQQYINEILARSVSEGMANNYQFCTAEKSNGTLIVFTDKSAEMNMMKKLKRITMIVGSISVVVLSALAYFLSGLIVRPIKMAFEKQKQFISDASHELKTPLTVISANADVLSGEIGDNKWLNYIQDQTDRMNVLVNDLLNLTRLENNTSRLVFAEFDLSKAIENTALPFESQAFEANKNFVLAIDKGIRTVGSEQHIKQMAAIFIDNAIKYAKDGGTVRVSLCVENGKPVLSVYNTGKGVKDSEKDKIFERFYRSDASRNRQTGGYGLGLAIAKSIIDKHRFKIAVENEEGKSICFVITM